MADLDHLAEPFGRQQGGPRALALDHRVRGKCRAVDDQAHLLGRDARLRGHRTHRREHTVFRRARRGERLCREAAFADFERHIGERPADIEAKPDFG